MKDEASRTADAAADMVVVADFIGLETPRWGWWLRLVMLFEIWDGYAEDIESEVKWKWWGLSRRASKRFFLLCSVSIVLRSKKARKSQAGSWRI